MTPPSGRRMGEWGRAAEQSHPEVELGAYLLAALPPHEEASVEEHLLHCLACQDRLVELSGALPPLGRVAPGAALALVDAAREGQSPADASGAGAEPGSGASGAAAAPGPDRVIGRLVGLPGGAHRSPSRWRIAAAAGGVAAAAAAAVLAAVVIGASRSETGAGAGPTQQALPSVSAGSSTPPTVGVASLTRVFPYTGDDTVTVRAWNDPDDAGASVTVMCQNDRTPPPVPDPQRPTYELWALRQDGTAYKVSEWKAVYGVDSFPGRLDFTVDQIRAFELRSAGDVLSTVS